MRKVYFNGEFVSEAEARISIFDSALMFGDMVFDMTRTYLQKPFRLRAHLERIYAGLKYLDIDCGLTLEEMEETTLRDPRDRISPHLKARMLRSCTISRADPSECTKASSEVRIAQQ